MTSYYEKFFALPVELQDICADNWDETGRPIRENTLFHVLVAVLKKNPDGYAGFKQDMKLIDERVGDNDLALYYALFMAGANHVIDLVKK